MLQTNNSKLIFATGNIHKVREVNGILNSYNLTCHPLPQIIGLKDIGCDEDLPETSESIQGNAIQKAQFVFDRYQVDCFAEDTGLEIDGLDGKPGIYSARYAGPERDSEKNMTLVLQQLGETENRGAQFRTVIALIIQGKTHLFEGIARGEILQHKQGSGGFGYDPIFRPIGSTLSFAQMSQTEKNRISHRYRALSNLMDFLEKTRSADHQ